MTHPTPAAIRKVADRLQTVLERYPEAQLEMSQPSITRPKDHPCRTVACHGGYYLISYEDEWLKDSTETPWVIWNGEPIVSRENEFLVAHSLNPELMPSYKRFDESPFDLGAEQMAKDLGFSNHAVLEDWARDNPDLWGNSYGGDMFKDEYAFIEDCDDYEDEYAFIEDCDDYEPVTVTLFSVIEHWRRVGNRVEQAIKQGD